jgi:alpha-D-xyloside xylohydrolase
MLRWDDKTAKLTASGKLPTGQNAASLVQIVGAK